MSATIMRRLRMTLAMDGFDWGIRSRFLVSGLNIVIFGYGVRQTNLQCN
jgi:hypothetical protein